MDLESIMKYENDHFESTPIETMVTINDSVSSSYTFKYVTYNARIVDPIGKDGCWLWLDASDSNTITVADGGVSLWKDKSLSQYTFQTYSPTTTRQPTWNDDSYKLNNRPTVSFNRANSQYLIGNNHSYKVGRHSFYLFIIFKFKNTYGTDPTFQAVFNKSSYSTKDGRITCYRGANELLESYTTMSVVENSVTQPKFDMSSDTDFNMYSLICNRNTLLPDTCDSTVYVNGYNYDISASSVRYNYSTDPIWDLSTNANPILLGAYNSISTPTDYITDPSNTAIFGGSYLNGSIAEIISYSLPSNMPVNTIMDVEGYLCKKWGLVNKLPSRHAYYNAT